MDRIRNYIGRFLKTNKMNRAYELSTREMIIFFNEMGNADGNKFCCAICTLFDYGYVKGYRAAMAEMKKGGAV